jgi:phosphoglycolate phosphatase-like HAD superfamily hydrolase
MKNKKINKAVLFDIDGTILKCNGAGKRSFMKACSDVFGTFGAMDKVDFQGKTDPIIIKESLIQTGFSNDKIISNTDYLKNRYFHYLAEAMPAAKAALMPGIRELLNALSCINGIYTGLLTGNFRKSAQIKLSRFGLNDYFPFGVFGDDAAIRNNMPALAKQIIMEKYSLQIDFKNMIIIGDTIFDIECAKHAGAVSFAVCTGWTEKESLIAAGPDIFFDDLSDTQSVINSILSFGRIA